MRGVGIHEAMGIFSRKIAYESGFGALAVGVFRIVGRRIERVAVVVAECECPGRFQPFEYLGVTLEVGDLRDCDVHHDQVAVYHHEVGAGLFDEVLDELIRLVVAGTAHHLVFLVIVRLRVREHHDVEVAAVGDEDGGVAVLAFGRFEERVRRVRRGLVARDEEERRREQDESEQQDG